MKKKSTKNKDHKKIDTKILGSHNLDRRSFLHKSALTIIGGAVVSGFPFISLASKSLPYPFILGVASGDPLPASVVIWTRLAPEPLAGAGSMPKEAITVNWEVADDKSFGQVVKCGKAMAKPQYAHSVHVEVKGLEPHKYYYYRFKVIDETSPIGRTKTLPAYDANPKELNIAFASCNNYYEGFYSAYDHMAQEDIDMVFFLGDYIYENNGQGNIGRGHLPQKECFTLNGYRIRYGQYKSDPSLQDAHAAFPWIVIQDDHEVNGDWAGNQDDPKDKDTNFLVRRAAAFQAYYEHMPLRKASVPNDEGMKLYRNFTYGNLAAFNVLDTRQYRTSIPCNTTGSVLNSSCKEIYDPSRTMLGKEQEKWLFDNLSNSNTAWNIIPNPVLMAQMDFQKGAEKILAGDQWDGFIATRKRLFNTLQKNKISNMVTLTGDYHRNMAVNLLADFDDPNSPILGTELVGTSIASDGDGEDMNQEGKELMNINPHVKFYNARRGYVRCKITPEKIKADYRVVPYVSKPGAPIHTRATVEIKNGQPGVNFKT